MERDCQENTEVDSFKVCETHQLENGNCIEFIPDNGGNMPLPPEGYKKNHRVRMDGQVDDIDEEHFGGSLTISGPKFMNQTESLKRKSKFWNQTESSGRQPVSSEVSNFQGKTGIRASRRANAKKQEGNLVQTRQNTARSAENGSTPIWRWMPIQANSPFKTSSTAIKKTQPRKSSTSHQVPAQERTSQPTKNPKPSADVKVQSTSSTLASRASPTITKRQTYKNPVGEHGQTQQISKQSAKNPSTSSVRRSKVQVNSSYKLSSAANNRTHLEKGSSSRKVWRVKTKKQDSTREPKGSRHLKPTSPKISRNSTPPSSPERSRNSSPTSPVYYISCDGIVKTRESFTEKCVICERDLYSPFEDWEVEYSYDEYEDDNRRAILLPDVAVLACGHVFHSECLDGFVPEDQSSGPPCFVCFSSLT